jgi:hypothetical protein
MRLSQSFIKGWPFHQLLYFHEVLEGAIKVSQGNFR